VRIRKRLTVETNGWSGIVTPEGVASWSVSTFYPRRRTGSTSAASCCGLIGHPVTLASDPRATPPVVGEIHDDRERVGARGTDEALQARGEGALVKGVCPVSGQPRFPGRATDRGISQWFQASTSHGIRIRLQDHFNFRRRPHHPFGCGVVSFSRNSQKEGPLCFAKIGRSLTTFFAANHPQGADRVPGCQPSPVARFELFYEC
jgi:hypothetical protein